MLDTAAVDQIVANVLKQLSAGGSGAESGSDKGQGTSAKGGVASLPPAPSLTSHLSPLTPLVTLTDRIITGDILAEKASGATQIIIPDKAILTPTAHDFLKLRKVQLIRVSEAVTKAGAAKTDTGITSWKLITVTSTPAVARLTGELGTGWSREILGCPDDAASLAISSICRGDAGGIVILSKQHFRAACRANRNDKVRAVSISSPSEVKTAREQLRLNVIAIDPTNRSYFELKNILGAFTAPAK